MGTLCVKGDAKHPYDSPNMSPMPLRSPLNTIQTKMGNLLRSLRQTLVSTITDH